MTPVLAYWNTRGIAQPIRFLLEYTGTKFEDKYYECGPAPDFDKSCWFSVKETLGMDFPNLPYYIDGDVKVTQSNAIMRYIARKHDLCGKTEEEKIRIDILENQAVDFRKAFMYQGYVKFDKEAYLKTLPQVVERFSKFLGTRPWFAGDNISFVDFIMYELFYQHLVLDKDYLKDFKNIQDFQKRFENLKPIKDYLTSPRFPNLYVNNKRAHFGNK